MTLRRDQPPLYVVVDHRQDGRRRIVGEFIEPSTAAAAAALLRQAGAEVEVELISAVVDADGEKLLGGPR